MMIDIDTLLAWGAAYKKVAANEIIFQEGIPSQFYYQLVSGSVRWVNINDAAKSTESGNPGYDPKRGEGKFTKVEVGATLNAAMAATGEKVFR